jgi:hypothetical protein
MQQSTKSRLFRPATPPPAAPASKRLQEKDNRLKKNEELN